MRHPMRQAVGHAIRHAMANPSVMAWGIARGIETELPYPLPLTPLPLPLALVDANHSACAPLVTGVEKQQMSGGRGWAGTTNHSSEVARLVADAHDVIDPIAAECLPDERTAR